jgi:SWI/SNF-related matrix-associated actin-dependent regulator 1 of chromatin subfamily A
VTGRNAPCPCGSGIKRKKCCGADRRPAKPAYRPGDELDPRWWAALQAARAPRGVPSVQEDPRAMLHALGVAGRFDRYAPPADDDFEDLIEILEDAAPQVRRYRAREGDVLAFSVPFDEAILVEVKRLPRRRFDWRAREWIVPCDPEVAALVESLLERHPRLVATPDVTAWIQAVGGTHGRATATSVDGEGVFLVWSEGRQRPPALVSAAVAQGDGWLALPLDVAGAGLLADLDGLELDGVARLCSHRLRAGLTPPRAILALAEDDEGERVLELRTGWDRQATVAFRALPEVGPNSGGAPRLPADPALVGEVDAFLAERPGIELETDVEAALDALRAERRRAEATVALSLADAAEPLDLPALGGELQPFQWAAVHYALRQRRTFLADEQGLGKTVEALAALEADGAFPAVVVCPASMKLTWAREAARWLPHRSATVLHGRTLAPEAAAHLADADVAIVNYDILDAHVEALTTRTVRATVFDESHYVKEPRAKRTKAALALSEGVADDALRLALSGTPILNRPKELVSQLRVLGRLSDFGSGAGLARRYRGPDCHERLHWHLRGHGYVRRLKADVLPQLPAKRSATVPVALDNEREYRLAEADVIAWLRTQPLDLTTLDAKVAAALRAERLAQLNYLRRLAGRGKASAATAWIGDFLMSGEPLVVFAEHRDVQAAVLERFPAAVHVLGDDSASARDAAVAAFQDPEGPPLIVCSLRAAAHGLTLTRASNVCFLELDWTPARLDQAEDRCHRIGQRDAMTAWYLLAPDTLDETMGRLLRRKRDVIGAVTDGRAPAGEALVGAVVRELRGDGERRLGAAA